MNLFLKIRASWDIAQCSLVEASRPFRGAYYLHYRFDDGGRAMIEVVRTSETSFFFETTRLYIPRGSYFHTRCSKNLKSEPSCFLVYERSRDVAMLP
jgi:hypothetical protein